MSQHDETHYETDEISLVDLIAVLIRYRRMIIWGTVVVAILSIGVLFVLPAVGLMDGPASEFEVSVTVRVASLPQTVNRYGSVNFPVTLRETLLDPVYILPYYQQKQQQTDPAVEDDRTRPELLRYLEENYIGDEYQVVWSEAASSLTLTCACENPDNAEQFLVSLVENLAPAVAVDLVAQLTPVISVLEQSLAATQESLAGVVLAGSRDFLQDEFSSASIFASLLRYMELNASNSLASLSDLALAREYLTELSTSPATFFSVVGDTRVVATAPAGTSRSTTVVLSVVAAFFALCLAAFVRQYARNVRNDPVQLAKLKDAWGTRTDD